MKETFWNSKVKADILSNQFCDQLELNKIVLSMEELPYYYSLDVIVSLASSWKKERIEEYTFKPGIFRNPKNNREKYRDILSEQISNVLNELERIGYKFSSASICADDLENEYDVFISISKGREKEYDKKGREKKILKGISIIPSGPGFRRNLLEVSKMIEKIKEEKELDKEITEPDMSSSIMTLEDILWFVVKGTSFNVKNKRDVQKEVEKLKENCVVHPGERIYIESGTSNEKENCNKKDFLRPAWLIYIEKENLRWSIKEFHTGVEVQNELKKIWKRKTTRRAVAFHKLKPVRYSVYAQAEEGYIKVSEHDAHNNKSIQIVWNEKRL